MGSVERRLILKDVLDGKLNMRYLSLLVNGESRPDPKSEQFFTLLVRSELNISEKDWKDAQLAVEAKLNTFLKEEIMHIAERSQLPQEEGERLQERFKVAFPKFYEEQQKYLEECNIVFNEETRKREELKKYFEEHVVEGI